MFLMIICVYTFVLCTTANDRSKFIVDYFSSKAISNIFGWSCNGKRDDLLLMKELNSRNIFVALRNKRIVDQIPITVYSRYRKLGIFFDFDCCERNSTIKIFSEASEHRMFDALHHWLIMSSNLQSILQVVDDRAFGVSTNFVICVTADKNNYILHDIYNMGRDLGGSMKISVLSTWNKVVGFKIVANQNKILRRENFNGLKLRVVFLKLKMKPANVSLAEYLQDDNLPVLEGLSGYGFSIVTHLSELYNFSMAPFEAPVPPANDTFGAHARSLAENKADISGTSFLQDISRMSFVKYIKSDWPFRTCFIFRNPQPNKIRIHKILRPLDSTNWYLIAVIMTINTVSLTILLKYEKDEKGTILFFNSFLINIGSLCQQGTTDSVKYLSTRIAILSIFNFAFLIYIYYSSSIVSARLTGQIYKINDSLIELGKLNLRMSTLPMFYFKLLLNYPHWEVKTFNQKYWSKIPQNKWFMDPVTGMKLVQKGGLAYHTLPEVAYSIVNNDFTNSEICELMEVHLRRPTMVTFAVRYNSSFTELARVGLTKMSEIGLRKRQLSRWSQREPICRTDILSVASINIHEFAPQLMLLMSGMALATFLFVLERVGALENILDS